MQDYLHFALIKMFWFIEVRSLQKEMDEQEKQMTNRILKLDQIIKFVPRFTPYKKINCLSRDNEIRVSSVFPH